MKKVTIQEAEKVSREAGDKINALLVKYWHKGKTGQWELDKEDERRWFDEFIVVYNPMIYWRPERELPEEGQYALLSY